MTTSIRTLDDLNRMALFTAALLQMFLGCHLLPFRHILIEHTQPRAMAVAAWCACIISCSGYLIPQ